MKKSFVCLLWELLVPNFERKREREREKEREREREFEEDKK